MDGITREVIESQEKKSMILCEASLRACGSDDVQNLYIAEVRERYNSSKDSHR